jgi:hypothetical protein
MNSKCAFPIIAIALLVSVLPARAQSNQPVASASPDRSYRLLSEDEDWSFLSNPALRQDSGTRSSTFRCERARTIGTSRSEEKPERSGTDRKR